jgi:hypothetical protein
MKEDMAMNFEASAAVGAVTCSQGGVPFNAGHIQYWMGQAREARIERDMAMTDGHDRIAELNAEIDQLRAERDAAARGMRDRCFVAARLAFEDSMPQYVLIGPSGMAMAMCNAIRAVEVQSLIATEGEGK